MARKLRSAASHRSTTLLFATGLLTILGACKVDKEDDYGFGGGGTNGQTTMTVETLTGCSPTEVYGNDFPEGNYDDWADHDSDGDFEGTQCECQMNAASELRTQWVDVRALGPNEGTTGETVPHKLILRTPWSDQSDIATVGKGNNPWRIAFDFDKGEGTGKGDWTMVLSKRTAEGAGGTPTFVDNCSEFTPDPGDDEGAPWLIIADRYEPATTTVPDVVDAPGGEEDDQLCVSGTTAITQFQLVDLPTGRSINLLAENGEDRWHGSKATEISVVHWNSADELRVKLGTSEVVLTPANSTAVLPSGTDWWTGSLNFHADRVGSTGFFQNPTIEVEHDCPSVRAAGSHSAPAGYALTIEDITEATTNVTGLSAFASLVLDAENEDWPVYAVRIETSDTPVSGVESHILWLEVRGTRARTGYPILQTGTDAWSLDLSQQNFELEGTITRSGSNLTLNLTSGEVQTANGTLSLNQYSLSLPEL